ncbi:uncharacterized protein N7459_009596 [Penicillium hispanicum]|uniref:uncharacterized protein n=1 Tax=Penicillium hispanicum TaxID=1080232 RepID=UPI002541FBB7|nr:uncharacterized protein N7459_009596 [Penicillium hispanicum]KAJ5570166.1 hypothetical protein N7459_009596 [Penicillium hispanicum]
MDTTTTLASINELDAAMHQYAPTLVDPEDEKMAAMLMAFTNDDWEGLGEFSALAKKATDPVVTQVVLLGSPSSATTSLGAVVELDLTESPPVLSNRQLSADSGLGPFPSSSPKTPEYHPIPNVIVHH